MKKKLLFVAENMNMNGANKSLINLLTALKDSEIEIDLFLYSHTGPLLELLPSHIHLLAEDKYMFLSETDLKTVMREGDIVIRWLRVKCLAKTKFFKQDTKLLRQKIWNYFEGLPKEYDLAVGYCEGSSHSFILKKTNAKKKIGWVHIDYHNHKLEDWEKRCLKQLDAIATVSEECKNSLIEKGIPAEKIRVIYNILLPNVIKKLSDEQKIEKDRKKIELLTVGRLVPDKGIDILLLTAKRLVQLGYDISWKIIGEGIRKKSLEESIKQWNGNRYMTFLGNRINPYPYFQACDIYVQPSRTEGWGLAITEAKILEKPIVASDIEVFRKQICSGENGVLAEITPEAMSAAIEKLIRNPELVNLIKDNLRQEQLGNEKEVEKLYEFFE